MFVYNIWEIALTSIKINKGGISVSEYGIVLTTFESEIQAETVINEIIKNKLAACVQGANCDVRRT